MNLAQNLRIMADQIQLKIAKQSMLVAENYYSKELIYELEAAANCGKRHFNKRIYFMSLPQKCALTTVCTNNGFSVDWYEGEISISW